MAAAPAFAGPGQPGSAGAAGGQPAAAAHPYGERLADNPFLRALRTNPQLLDVFQRAPKLGWIVCVPVSH